MDRARERPCASGRRARRPGLEGTALAGSTRTRPAFLNRSRQSGNVARIQVDQRSVAMMRAARGLLLCAGFVAAVQMTVAAHFKLVEPASWLVESDRGDPQKAGPCGGSNTDWGKPSYAITKATGGQKLHIKVQETIYHPRHYR